MYDERETSATWRARADGVRELGPKLALYAGVFVLATAGSLLAYRNAATLGLLAFPLACVGVSGLAKLLYLLIPALSPGLCGLGRSVRFQSPACTRPLAALFADIDADIRDHGERFGGLHVGREWAIFLEAMRISRIRGIFAAVIEPEREGEPEAYGLWLVDADSNILEASLPSRRVLENARACLLERVPDACVGDENALENFLDMDEADRREINRRVLARQTAQAAPGPAAFAYAGPDGIPTSLATDEGIGADFAAAQTNGPAGPDGPMELIPLTPLFLPTGEECLHLACEPDGDRFRFVVFMRRGNEYRRAEQSLGRAEAETLFRDCFRRGVPPSVTGWKELAWELDIPPERQSLYVDGERFDDITFEDVEAALDGVDRGVYGTFSLMPPGDDGSLSLSGKQGGDYLMEAALPAFDGDLGFYRIRTPRRDQALFWFSAYYENAQPPYLDGWEDVTKERRRTRDA